MSELLCRFECRAFTHSDLFLHCAPAIFTWYLNMASTTDFRYEKLEENKLIQVS